MSVLWILQNNYVDAMTGRLAWALRRTERPMHDFSLIPGQPLPEFPCRPDDRVFFYGSTGLLDRLQRDDRWKSKVFDGVETLDQRHWQAARSGDLLNNSVEFLTLAELKASTPRSSFFVRPAKDHKAFSGQLVHDGDLSGLYRGRKGITKKYPEDLVLAMSAPVPQIDSEYRFVVLNNKVRAGSRYRSEGRLSIDGRIPANVQEQANELAAGWLPSKFTVMDVAFLPGGSAKIVEFNSAHSSGLYAIDGEKFADIADEAVLSIFPRAGLGRGAR